MKQNNLVAKHDFNRAATHPDKTKYKRLQAGNDLYDYWDEYIQEKSVKSDEQPGV